MCGPFSTEDAALVPSLGWDQSTQSSAVVSGEVGRYMKCGEAAARKKNLEGM